MKTIYTLTPDAAKASREVGLIGIPLLPDGMTPQCGDCVSIPGPRGELVLRVSGRTFHLGMAGERFPHAVTVQLDAVRAG